MEDELSLGGGRKASSVGGGRESSSTAVRGDNDDEDLDLHEEQKTLAGVTRDFFGNRFSAHAIPHVANATGHVRRVIWAMISLILLILLLVQILVIINEYLLYPKQVTIEVVEEDVVTFPSVTVCNFNVMKKDRLVNTKFEGLLELEKYSDKGDCSDYGRKAPWVVNKDYAPVTAKDYWSINDLNSQSQIKEEYVMEISTSESTTLETATPYSPSTTEDTTSTTDATTSTTEATASTTEVTTSATEATTNTTEATTSTTEATTGTTESTTSTTEITKSTTEATTTTTTPLTTPSTTTTNTISTTTTTSMSTTTPTMPTSTTTRTTTAAPTTTTTSQSTTEILTTFPSTATAAPECTTVTGVPCAFPFFYYDRNHTTCIPLREGSWCATVVDEQRMYAGEWEYCGPNCQDTGRRRRSKVPNQDTGRRRRSKAPNQDPMTTESVASEGNPMPTLSADTNNSTSSSFSEPDAVYNGMQKVYDNRSESFQWCKENNLCLETYGMEGQNEYNYEKLLAASNREDLSDLKAVFTPSLEDILKLGQKPQEFITTCTFDKKGCSFKDFYMWQSDTYGNCFTFNSPNLYQRSTTDPNKIFRDDHIRKTTKSGYQNGLRLTLNLDVENYVSLLSADMGVRVVVHDPSHTPIPEQEGFSIAPAFVTSIGIRMKKITRIGHPHGICQPDKWRNIPRRYSQASCRMLCLEERIQKACNCSNAINDLLIAIHANLPRCNPTNLTQELCRQEEAMKDEVCDCPPACNDVVYTPIISLNNVNKRFFNLVKNKKSLYVGEDVCSEWMNSTARVHIYLETLQQEVIKEKAAYTLPSLIANIGGYLGLFIGLSLATLIEFAEFVFDLILLGRRGAVSGCSQSTFPCNRSADRREKIARTPVMTFKNNNDVPEPVRYDSPTI